MASCLARTRFAGRVAAAVGLALLSGGGPALAGVHLESRDSVAAVPGAMPSEGVGAPGQSAPDLQPAPSSNPERPPSASDTHRMPESTIVERVDQRLWLPAADPTLGSPGR